MNRRGFLKGLSAIPVAAAGIKFVEEKRVEKLTNLQIAEQFDKNFQSPHLYVRAIEPIRKGEAVVFGKEPYTVKRVVRSLGYKPFICGIAVDDLRPEQYGFIQTIAHVNLVK